MTSNEYSSLKIITNDQDLNVTKWQHFVEKNPNGNYFYLPSFYYLCKSSSFFSPHLIALVNDDYEIMGLLIYFVQSRKFITNKISFNRIIIWGEPFFSPGIDTSNLHEILLSIFIKEFKKKSWVYCEIRNFTPPSPDFISVCKKYQFHYKYHYNIHLEISEHFIWSDSFSKSKVRQIKQSLKNGAKIVIAETLEEFHEFYKILKLLYRTKIKKPLPDWNFFMAVFQTYLEQNNIKIILIKFNNKVIGGSICPVFSNRVLYNWYIAGLDKHYSGIFPSVLATFGLIDHACRNNYKMVDFMGAGTPKKPYGVRDFKLRFGGKLIQTGRYIKVNNRFLYFILRLALKFKIHV